MQHLLLVILGHPGPLMTDILGKGGSLGVRGCGSLLDISSVRTLSMHHLIFQVWERGERGMWLSILQKKHFTAHPFHGAEPPARTQRKRKQEVISPESLPSGNVDFSIGTYPFLSLSLSLPFWYPYSEHETSVHSLTDRKFIVPGALGVQ